MSRLTLAIAATFLAVAPATAADDPAAPPPAPDVAVAARPRWLSTSASVLPGLVLHGSGVWLAGDREAASRLAISGGVGLGMMTAGILPIILTDASGQNIDLSVAMLAAGTGLFVTSWMADVYGAMTGGRQAAPPGLTPLIEPFVGFAYVHDPQFEYRDFTVMRLDARAGRFRMTPRAWLAMNSDNQQLGLDVALRLGGPRPDRRAADGSFVDVQMGATYHRFGDDRFSILTTELLVPARLDLRRIGRVLAGSFVSFELGWALQMFDYWMAGRGLGTDINGLLLVRFGLGVYLGGPESPRGEVELYYDHRHDGFAGGLALDIHDPNFLGHVGMSVNAWLNRHWAVRFAQEVGSASVTSIGLAYQLGGGP